MKKVLPVLVVVLALAVVFRDRIPGLKSRIERAAERYVGWTADARHDDPVGYIDYAQKELAANLEKFRAAQGTLAKARAEAGTKLEQYQTKHLAAIQLSEDARGLYQGAEAAIDGSGYPVTLLGKQYDRDQLVQQVRKILAERDLYADMQGQFEGVIADLEAETGKLGQRIQATEFQLTKLRAQREVVELQQLTKEADEVLAKVDEILGENHAAIQTIDEPVRSVEELMQQAAKDTAGTPEEAAEQEVLLFLQS